MMRNKSFTICVAVILLLAISTGYIYIYKPHREKENLRKVFVSVATIIGNYNADMDALTKDKSFYEVNGDSIEKSSKVDGIARSAIKQLKLTKSILFAMNENISETGINRRMFDKLLSLINHLQEYISANHSYIIYMLNASDKKFDNNFKSMWTGEMMKESKKEERLSEIIWDNEFELLSGYFNS